MKTKLYVDILPQPDDHTCGPTCLHAIYRYYNDDMSLDQVISEAKALEGGGTLAVFLGCHALKRGYKASILSYNLDVFDPTWFADPNINLIDKLNKQRLIKTKSKIQVASKGYLEFLELGGEIRFENLCKDLITHYLDQSIPILTGLSATYLYQSARELMVGNNMVYDDLKGEPSGHFVILCGYDKNQQNILVADPFLPNPFSETHQYLVDVERVIPSILLGILTYDANLLIIHPPEI